MTADADHGSDNLLFVLTHMSAPAAVNGVHGTGHSLAYHACHFRGAHDGGKHEHVIAYADFA